MWQVGSNDRRLVHLGAGDHLSVGSRAWDQEAHQRALMLQRRCGYCAERVGPGVLLRGKPCPHCGRDLRWPSATDAESVIAAVEGRWKRRRWWIYGLVTGSAALTGFLPFVPTLVALGFMVVLRYSLLREPLEWFSRGRRLTSKFTLKLWLVTIGCLTLTVNELLNVLLFVNVFLKAAVCLGTTALFVEVSLWFLRGRLRREAYQGPDLDGWEWGVPAALMGGVLVLGASAILAVVLTWEVVVGLFRSVTAAGS